MAMADASAMKRDRLEIVRAWHEAVNRGDADALLALSDEDIEVGGPRGSARGSAVLRNWLGRAGIQLEPRRWFASPSELVVEQVATWQSADHRLLVHCRECAGYADRSVRLIDGSAGGSRSDSAG